MTAEASLLRSLLVSTSRLGARLFRNQTGRYRLALPDCPRCQAEGRVIASGLCVGSPDLVGWVPVTIGPEHLGRTLAVFVGLEAKAPKGRVRPEQAAFVQALAQAGGVAAVVRSCVDAHHALWGVRGVCITTDCGVTDPDERV